MDGDGEVVAVGEVEVDGVGDDGLARSHRDGGAAVESELDAGLFVDFRRGAHSLCPGYLDAEDFGGVVIEYV